MTLNNGYTDLPPGKIASIVTYLEMTEAPDLQDVPATGTVRLVEKPEPAWYRKLFRAVGEDWLWFSRLILGDDALRAEIQDPSVELYVYEEEGVEKGILEFDLRGSPDIHLDFLGLTRDAIGKGAGRYLMTEGLRIAWARKPTRVWLHTCTIDSPQALPFYLKFGFRPYKRAIEIAEDPRLRGWLPETAAPRFPVIRK